MVVPLPSNPLCTSSDTGQSHDSPEPDAQALLWPGPDLPTSLIAHQPLCIGHISPEPAFPWAHAEPLAPMLSLVGSHLELLSHPPSFVQRASWRPFSSFSFQTTSFMRISRVLLFSESPWCRFIPLIIPEWSMWSVASFLPYPPHTEL